MKSVVVLEIETNMNEKTIKEITKGEQEGEQITRQEVEQSIHDAIPRLLDDDRIKEEIQEIINEGGWIEDFEDYEFPKDYCDLKIKVLNCYD